MKTSKPQVIIQRRSDGKFWLNLGYHGMVRQKFGNTPNPDPGWAADLKQCTPFRSESGARNALASSFGIEFYRTLTEGCCRYPYCNRHKKELAGLSRERFNKKYKLLVISIVQTT